MTKRTVGAARVAGMAVAGIAATVRPVPLNATVGVGPGKLVQRFRCEPGQVRFGFACNSGGFYDTEFYRKDASDESPLIIAIVILSILSEMMGVVGIQIGASRRYDGPMGKSDRAFWFSALGLLLGLGVQPGIWVHILLGVMTTLLVLTIFNRAQKALKEVPS